MDRKMTAEERFFSSLRLWDQLPSVPQKERVLDASTDVNEEVERAFAQWLGRTSIPPM